MIVSLAESGPPITSWQHIVRGYKKQWYFFLTVNPFQIILENYSACAQYEKRIKSAQNMKSRPGIIQ